MKADQREERCDSCQQQRVIVHRHPEHGKLCQRCYKRLVWRPRGGEAVERERAAARRYKRSHRQQINAAESKRRQGRCPRCNGPTATDGTALCRKCRRAESKQRQREILALWLQGKTLREIAAHFGVDQGTIGAELTRMRRQGVDVPYRQAHA